MKLWCVALALFWALWAVSPAWAQEPAIVTEALGVADAHWQAAGYAPAPAEIVLVQGAISGHAAGAELGGRRVYLGSEIVWLATQPGPRLERRVNLYTLCAILVHERGHNLGFTHDSGGIMTHITLIPGRCIAWAVSKTLPRPKTRRVKKR